MSWKKAPNAPPIFDEKGIFLASSFDLTFSFLGLINYHHGIDQINAFASAKLTLAIKFILNVLIINYHHEIDQINPFSSSI